LYTGMFGYIGPSLYLSVMAYLTAFVMNKRRSHNQYYVKQLFLTEDTDINYLRNDLDIM